MRDRTVMDKIAYDDKPAKNWCDVVQNIEIGSFRPRNKHVKALLEASRVTPVNMDSIEVVKAKAKKLRTHLGDQ